MPREQKAAVLLFAAIGLLGVVFGARSITSGLRRPFDLQLARGSGKEFLLSSEREELQKQKQKALDTDADGLTDYDELYVYKTSAYLKDSDSDGFDDKTELFSGSDPNCPKDKQCGVSTSSADFEPPVGTPAEELVPSSTPPDLSGALGSAAGNLNVNSPDDLKNFLNTLGADEIRKLLAAQGVSADTLAKVTDEQLLDLFQKTAAEAEASGALDSSGSKQP